MTDDQDPMDSGTDPGMTYGEWKTGGVPKRDAASEKDRADARVVLAAAVAEAPPAPSIEQIAARIVGTASTRSGAAPADAAVAAGSGAAPGGARAPGDDDLPTYGDLGRHREDRSRRTGARWPRAALAAAAVLAIVVVGAVVLGSRDEPEDNVVAEQPDESEVVPGAEQALAMVPADPPEGLVPVWVSSGVSDEGDPFAAVHYASPAVGDDGLPVGSRLKIESAVVDPAEVDLVADARESGSLELWDGREVVVTDDGGTAQFVDPSGVQVLVQGDPEVVRAVVPTLRALSTADWQVFLDDLGTEVAALPTLATVELTPNESAEGVLTMPGATVVETVQISMHGDPEAVDGDAAPAAGEGGSGAVAGTCLTVNGVTACRPGELLGEVEGGVQSSYDVLIDGIWWHFGWSTNELTEVTVTPDRGMEGPSGVRWTSEGTGHGTSMSWYASALPTEARQIQVELHSAVTTSGFGAVRPAH